MKVENQVCTFEQGKRLAELGVTGKSYFTWLNAKSTKDSWHGCLFQPDYKTEMFCIAYPEGMSFDDFGDDNEFFETGEHYPAFTVAELGLMLPKSSLNPALQMEGGIVTGIWKGRQGFRFRGLCESDCSQSISEAEARAGMLIHLLESQVIIDSECNARLIAD